MATYDASGGDTTAREIETAEEWIAAARAAERRGELLEAVDLAQSGLERFPADVPLRYEVVLNLARAGSTEEARRRFRDYELGEEGAEDIASLGARLEKDVALSAAGSTRRRHAAHAAALYADVFARTGGYYPGINAATLRCSLAIGRGRRPSRAKCSSASRLAGTRRTSALRPQRRHSSCSATSMLRGKLLKRRQLSTTATSPRWRPRVASCGWSAERSMPTRRSSTASHRPRSFTSADIAGTAVAGSSPARVWDARTGRLLRVLPHPDAVNNAAFSPDSRSLATLDFAGTIRVWDACPACEDSAALMAIARDRVTRQLTESERLTFGVSTSG